MLCSQIVPNNIKCLTGFVILSNLNLAWLTNSKCVICYAQKINLKIFDLFIVIFVCQKFGIGFVVPKSLVTYLSNVGGILYVL